MNSTPFLRLFTAAFLVDIRILGLVCLNTYTPLGIWSGHSRLSVPTGGKRASDRLDKTASPMEIGGQFLEI